MSQPKYKKWRQCKCAFKLFNLNITQLNNIDKDKAIELINKKWKQRILILHPDKLNHQYANEFSQTLNQARDILEELYKYEYETNNEELSDTNEYTHNCSQIKEMISLIETKLNIQNVPREDNNPHSSNTTSGYSNTYVKSNLDSEISIMDLAYRRKEIKLKIQYIKFDITKWKDITVVMNEHKTELAEYLIQLKKNKPRKYANLLEQSTNPMEIMELIQEYNKPKD